MCTDTEYEYPDCTLLVIYTQYSYSVHYALLRSQARVCLHFSQMSLDTDLELGNRHPCTKYVVITYGDDKYGGGLPTLHVNLNHI